MSECLKYHDPNQVCMEHAIISHNIDFVTFLMNEYKLDISLYHCTVFKNLESFYVYFDQTNDINTCFAYSLKFNVTSLFEYFFSLGADIKAKNDCQQTALHCAADNNSKEMAEFLISHGANVNKKR
ncbi:hypothetical protein TVAG_260800 [Trichomonas vaginalis G3]|uniref:DUF3447 domain-containing protein n=1 Tax=Trichomonas vaginalis (strain ATCC PRA-98 / G3) TaxID=412133 RepID=A2EXK3_TRIV3|nr:ankyrin repeat and SOCS box-containing protein 4 family [Trichomonas vaginalis G3]EAY02620.1 hypothetical protein TVAG_260800 [Trichomonas vaginalis G3]KAI5553348.1 ankyrin repeat and SOCS box-containing protein 4 family [Trichomonas vaginalis G3]|eukprot:XP_001314843.1 hypothetical protein [Trichomonas vaginalis G3]